ncbi:hypothetical protein SADO_02495 [Salinisphaera dokdonensis CL-ES53]|uniref:Cytoskeleton protein RodZ-like C-terminal domain-containing protein n=1 Tax=Salinisphaera dokdonensis CL-ES53 TaxID=1304272 RepID=A0ABV2AY64_9GAMM
MNESMQPSDESVPERPARNRSDMKSPGELLREARLAHDWSVEDLCAETKLSEKSVHALENNEFDQLSQPIFAGGYYRQCAKVLDIDAEQMNQAYAAWGGKKTSSQTAPPAAVDVVPQDVTPPNWRAFGIIGLVVLALVVGAVFLFMPDGDLPEENAGADGDTAALASGQGGSSSGNRIGSGNSSATGNGRPTSQRSRETGTSLRVSPGASDGPGSADRSAMPNTGQRSGGRNVNDTLGIDREAERRRREAEQAPPEPQVAPNHLAVNFTDRSWVDIRDANGSRLLTGIYEAGETREFEADAPYRITLGYAPGVSMQIGGQDVDVQAQTTSNSTARLTVEARDN